MAGRLTTTSSTIMEDREALKREAARERQKRGAMSGAIPGNGTQNRPSRSSVLEPHASLNAGLFGAPVKVEQRDPNSIMIKNVLGNYQNLSKIIQGSSVPISHGASAHFGSAQATQHPPPAPQPSRRPLPAGAPPVDQSRPAHRQPNGVASPARGIHSQANPKAISQASNYSKPLMTAAARKSHVAEPAPSMKPAGTDLPKKSAPAPFHSAVPKPASNSNNGSNNSSAGSNRLTSATELSRLEEVLKEMRVPPLLPDMDEVDKRDARRKEEREDKQRTSAPANDLPLFPNSLGLGGLPLPAIEHPPVALSPMSSPVRDLVAPPASVPSATTTTTGLSANQNQRLHGQVPTALPPQVPPMSAPAASSGSSGLSKKSFDIQLPHVPMTCLSSDSSESEDDDDHESASQEDSQDSDVEQKSMRMNQAFDKSFASTEKFPDKSNQFGDGGVPSLFPQQRVPQLQVQPPNSTEGQSIESPLSASDDTNAEESKASWGLAAFMPGATPNSVTSSVKSPIKSSPRRSPTPSCDATPGKTARDTRNEYRNGKRAPSASDHSKESSTEPAVEKRRATLPRNSMTPDADASTVTKNAAARKLNAPRVSPLAQNHHEGSNGVTPDEPKRRKLLTEESPSLMIRIPLSILKRRPLQGSKCDNSSNQVGGSNVGAHTEVKPRLDRFESNAPTKLTVEETRDSKDAHPSKQNNNGEDRRADSPMSIESISSSCSSRKRHHSPEEKSKKPKEDPQASRKKPNAKRERTKNEIEASLRRERESSNTRKDEKRKTMPEDKRAREESKAPTGPSSSTPGATQAPSRTKHERREVKTEIKEEPHRNDAEPFAVYKHHLATNRFDWGMRLSDAAKRAAEEQTRTKYEPFIEEAKALKHAGDSESTNVMKSKKYLQSAACFLSAGHLMELSRPEWHTASKMFQDTLMLVKHTFNQVLQKAPLGASQECRLAILSLKVQAYLCYRIYVVNNRDKESKERLQSSHQEFMRIPVAGASKHNNSEQPMPNGAIVSPANSIGSASSGVQSGRDNGLRQDVAAMTQPKQISLGVDLVANCHKFYQRQSFATRAVDLWAQAENMTAESNNQDFFQAVESGSANASIWMPATTFVLYVREAIYRIDKFNGVV